MINPKNPAKHPNLHTYHDLSEEIQDNHMALHSCPKHQPNHISDYQVQDDLSVHKSVGTEDSVTRYVGDIFSIYVL